MGNWLRCGARAVAVRNVAMTLGSPFRAAAVVTRGEGIDAWHGAAAAVVDGRGRVTHALGDADLITFTRSAIKPLQALPLVLTGASDSLGLDDEELALAAASHDGGDRQRDIAARLLGKAGAGAAQLLCGAHWPIGLRIAGHRPCAGEDRDPLRHNCSGKHAGFLAVARVLGVPAERYLDPDSPVQRAVRRAVADACEIDESDLRVGIDGCSAPNFAVALSALARGFKNLATRGPGGAPLDTAFARVRAAMQAHPDLVSGPARFDYELARAFAGRIVCKRGAEGVQAIGFSDPPLGVVVKVLDGTDRALAPITMAVLAELGLVDAERRAALAHLVRPIVTNYRGIETGAVLVSGPLLTAHDDPG
jgi:L-asparaginase II